jgi:alkylation response protein AidB-like acyl-CoA dehydrogenase
MDFSWSQEQQKRYTDTVSFAREHLKAPAATFSREVWRACGQFGLLGLPVAREVGGQGLDALTCARVVEAVGRGGQDLGMAFSMFVNVFACNLAIARFGSAEQKQEVLPRLCSGDWVGAMALTEPDADSDVLSLKTKAVREADAYLLSGEKTWVTNGPVADLIVVQAVTDPDGGDMGVSAFLVEKHTPGLRVGAPVDTVGLSTAPICSLQLEDARVPRSRLLGQEGQGGPIFRSTTQWERTCVLALYVGTMEQVLERTLAFARGRTQLKKPIGQNQAVSHRIADMKLRLESARLLLYRACWRIDQGADAEMDVSLAKIAISEAAIQTVLDAIQIHGGVGCLKETGLDQLLRDGLPSTIFSGTSEFHRNLVAARLGL